METDITSHSSLKDSDCMSNSGLLSDAKNAMSLAVSYTFEVAQPDGHWYGEQKGNATITSEYVFLRQALGLDMTIDQDALCRYLLSDQNCDGSWGLAPDIPGDVSTSTEAYLALKILGVATDAAPMQRARDFILAVGGVARVRIFTRFYLASFGLFPWTSVPEMPAELILLPSWAPINVYRLSSWARAIVVPLLILSHHRPVFALPNGRHNDNDYLDELWCGLKSRDIPYSKSIQDLLRTDWVAFSFAAADTALSWLGGLRAFPQRKHARKQVVKWMLERQEGVGDFGGGIFPADHFCILALILEGFSPDDSRIVRGLEAVERLAWVDSRGKRIQPCVGPVWDTILMAVALCDSGLDKKDDRLGRAVEWIKVRQLFGPQGDWRVYQPDLAPGGFSFEYANTWYPDVDDTAAIIIGFIKHDPRSANSLSVTAAVEWILGMQNRDAGWGAFDHNNDYLFLNKIPFSDMGALCDPSSADVTGRILEAFGLLHRTSAHVKVREDILEKTKRASERAIQYIESIQETTGAWYGRWGCNYIYGTSNVLCGLVYYTKDNTQVQRMIEPALEWLKKVQNTDGGWGEGLNTYADPTRAGCGVSTASQTAWGAMGLMAHLPRTDEAIRRGIGYLVKTQNDMKGDGATWPQRLYTGVGFPIHWYLGYSLYSHYFPMMALGRYLHDRDGTGFVGGEITSTG